MSCYYDYFINACVCEQQVENIPLSELFFYMIEIFNV